ncbi:gfo/Idh/MocA family oxidoreductase [candidate division KSB1 bacterium]|nr:Gfo/Idh/MocA family oxidoreductase [candidate division KSB1 bacterium]RQW04763.1 MAG: gfo/Idh/MocA family oxidoreductase [candidate division KSB1 bacterium]
MYKKETTSGANKPTIRVGLIGHQFMGLAHSNAFRNASIWYDMPCTIEMAAVCAKDSEENLQAFADKFGWQSIETDYNKLCARDDIDLISVATPGFLHKPMVLAAVQHGKHVLCEKPLANTLDDAVEMARAAEKKGIRHCCGYSYRSTPSQALAKQLVDEGKIGRIFHVHARYAQDWIVDPDFAMVWRFDKKLAGSGSLGDICAHSIDAARFITGMEFKEIVGHLKTMVPERPLNAENPEKKGTVTVDDVAQFLCIFDNGATGCFEATRLATGRKNNNCIEINGDKGSLYWDFEDQNYLYFYDRTAPTQQQGFARINATDTVHPYSGGPWPVGHGIGYADCFVIEVVNFLTAITEGKAYHPDFHDGVAVQKVLDAVEQSATKKKWITL